MLFGGVNMAPATAHHRLPASAPPPPLLLLLLICAVSTVGGRSSQISDLKSKISGVEELLEEFRKQLQQDQAYQTREAVGEGDAADSCLSGFTAAGERIIRARASIEQGATFLSAPGGVRSWADCLHACCAEPRCTVAVVPDDFGRTDEALSCYLFNCTYNNKNVCSFAPQQGFSTYSRAANTTGHPSLDLAPGGQSLGDNGHQEVDEPPRSDAGQDVVIRLPTDWAVLDGRDSVDDHGISHYEWALMSGDSAINMKVTHPGLLKVSGLQQGVYTFQMVVTDNAGQKSSDNVSVTVLAPEHHPQVCTGQCSRYQFMCDDGCCIDITYACDGKQQCPDRSDEAFCRNFDSSRKSVTHPAGDPSQPRPVDEQTAAESDAPPQVPPERQDRTKVPPPPAHPAHPQTTNRQEGADSQDPCAAPPFIGPCKETFPRWYYDQEAAVCKHFLYGGCHGNHNNFLQEADCVNKCVQKSPAFKLATVAPPTTKQTETAVSQGQPERDLAISKPYPVLGGHPEPESGAILPLALGLIITSLLLMMIICRLQLVRHKLKKTRPLTTEESDYLINGMYL